MNESMNEKTCYFTVVVQCKFMPFTGDCHMVTCAREGHVRLAELSSTGTCKTTRKLAQHHGAAHKVIVYRQSKALAHVNGATLNCVNSG